MFNCCTRLVFLLGIMWFTSCRHTETPEKTTVKSENPMQYLVVLGIAQDAGFPQIDNAQEWRDIYEGKRKKEWVSCLAMVDAEQNNKWIFDATPDMPQQLDMLESDYLKTEALVHGVFLTHAHMGHYTGLMHFGREAMGAQSIPVYAMPQMKLFLENNGPWSQLVSLKNIEIRPLKRDSVLQLSPAISVTPFKVPHRDEYSETVGYEIVGKNKSALFIPDINKWNLWEKNIVEEVKKVDYAFIDATFFKDGEIPRPMEEVPHPFIEETVHLFKDTSEDVRNKVIFIHFNHSNPALLTDNPDRKKLEARGFRFAETGMLLPL